MNLSKQINLGLFLIVVALVLWAMIQRSCNEIEYDGKTDTTYIKGIPDTIIIHDTTFKYVDRPIAVNTTKYVHDTIHVLDSLLCDSVRNYMDSLEDGTCKAVYTASVRGALLGWSVNLMSRSMEINRVDTVKITLYPNKWRVGIGAGISSGLFIYGSASRGRNQFIGGYDLKTKVPFVGVGWMISK